MKIYPEEIAAAARVEARRTVPLITAAQRAEVIAVGRRWMRRCDAHPHLHNAVTLALLAVLVAADVFSLAGFPGVAAPSRAVRALVAGCAHGWLAYSLIVFTMHEGAAHRLLFVPVGPVSRALDRLSVHVCRLFFADPVYFRAVHPVRHAKFGTAEDASFLNFVWPTRFWRSLVPYAGFLDFNDYRIHCDTGWSSSRVLSTAAGLAYLLAAGLVALCVGDPVVFACAALVLGPWLSFTLDRLRETTEHNLMPRVAHSGARDQGLGPWAFLVCGGPWGQPCHLSHHLVPSVPWYGQLAVHRALVRVLRDDQRRTYLVGPVAGFWVELVRILRTNHAIAREIAAERRRA